MIRVADYPQLSRILWSSPGLTSIDDSRAARHYETHARYVEWDALTEAERTLIERLAKEHESRVLTALISRPSAEETELFAEMRRHGGATGLDDEGQSITHLPEDFHLGVLIMREFLEDHLTLARLIKNRDWQCLLAAARIAAPGGVDPQLAIADPAKYRSLREAVTLYHLKGYGCLNVQALEDLAKPPLKEESLEAGSEPSDG